MKIKKIKIVLLLTVAVFLSSCNWIDTDLNIDPNNPLDVPIELVIPSIQANIAYDLSGNDAVMPTNLWMQYLNGYARQAQVYSTYRFTPADVNNLWNAIYAGEGMDCVVLIDKSRELGAYNTQGIGEVMLAYIMAITTDLFGDIPYSESFYGPDGLNPAADAQESVYAAIETLLDSAIIHLNAEDLVGVSGDMIFDNSTAAWEKTAYALKARNAINLSERNGSAAYTAALAALENAYTSSDDNFAFTFGTKSNERSPISQFVIQRNDIVMGKYFVDLLLSNSDPRISTYANRSDAGTFAGTVPADDSIVGISFPGKYISSSSVAVTAYFMTYAECKFIEAEALLATDADLAAEAYKEGVAASLVQVLGDTTGVSSWLDTNVGGETGATITLEKIIMQKYIANYGQVQPYNDYRRTGYPADLYVPVDATTPLPKRFPYAQEEITYNPNIEELWNAITLSTPVWWDAN